MKLSSILCLVFGLSFVSAQASLDLVASSSVVAVDVRPVNATYHALDQRAPQVQGRSPSRASKRASRKKPKKTVKHSAQKTANHSVQKTTKHSPQKTSKHSAQKTTKHPPQKTTKHSPQKTTKKASEKTTKNTAGPKETSTHLKASKIRTTSSPTSTNVPLRGPLLEKCSTSGSCGAKSCSKSRPRSGIAIRSYPIASIKRAFTPISKWAELERVDTNSDISTSRDWLTGWNEFANTDVSSTIKGLSGCSVVTIYSQSGFQAFHLFESPGFIGDSDQESGEEIPEEQRGWLKVDPGETLYPGKKKKYLKQKLKKVASELKKTKAMWGDDVQVSLLMPSGEKTTWRYDESEIYEWEPVRNKKGLINQNQKKGMFNLNKKEKPPSDASAEIIHQIGKATGVDVQPISYEVVKGGTKWAIQYSPDESGQRQVQIWVDDKPQLVGNKALTWAKPKSKPDAEQEQGQEQEQDQVMAE